MAIKLEYKQSSIVIFFWIANLGVYAIPFLFLDPWLENIDFRLAVMPHAANVIIRNNQAVIRCAIFAISFNALYLITRSVTRNQVKVLTPATWSDLLDESDVLKRVTFVLTCGMAIGCIISILSIVLTVGIQGLLSASYGSFRLDANPYLKLVGYTVCGCSGAVIFISWMRKQYLNLFFCIICLLVVFLLGRTRQLLLPAIIPFALYYIYKAKGINQKIGLIFTAVCVYVSFLFLQQMRYRGSLVDCILALGTWHLYEDVWLAVFDGKGELLPRGVYYWYMEHGNELEGFGQGLTYKRLLMLPFPSALCFGLKPPDFTGIMYHDFYRDAGDIGPSIHPLFYGDAYTNFSWYGVTLGAFWAGLVSFIEHFCQRLSRLVSLVFIPVLGFGALMIARGAVYNSCVMMFWSCIIISAGYLYFFSGRSVPKISLNPKDSCSMRGNTSNLRRSTTLLRNEV